MKRRQKSIPTITLFLLITLMAIPLSVAAAEKDKTVAYETGFYYTVQKGDTLWDLSQKFSDTPWQWPELWKENDKIANPHRIYPGERIRLYRRRGAHGYGGGEGDDQKKATEDSLKAAGLIDFQYASIERVGFIRKEPVAAHGTIFKVEDQKQMISAGDLIYIRPADNSTLNPGDMFTIYRTLKPIEERGTHNYIGIQHYLVGVVEITIKRPEFVLGNVVASYRDIRVGDLLMPYQKRLPRFDIQESPEGLRGQIIVNEEHTNMFGENSIAFIDKGEQEGVMPGQLFWIFKQEKYQINPDARNEVTLTPVILGELLVIHTEKTTATVMITDSRNAIHAGALIASPFKLD